MALNTRNYGFVEGRLTKNPAIFDNADGSKKVRITVAAQNNFTGKDGQRGVNYVDLEGFVPAGRNIGVYSHMAKGDLIGIQYTVVTNNYTGKDGQPVYGQVLRIQTVDLRESKATTAARAAKNATAAAAPVESDATPDFDEAE